MNLTDIIVPTNTCGTAKIKLETYTQITRDLLKYDISDKSKYNKFLNKVQITREKIKHFDINYILTDYLAIEVGAASIRLKVTSPEYLKKISLVSDNKKINLSDIIDMIKMTYDKSQFIVDSQWLYDSATDLFDNYAIQLLTRANDNYLIMIYCK